MQRVVIDTNVFLSGLLGGQNARAILLALAHRKYQLIISETILEELADVLARPEWLRLVDPADWRELLTVIHEAATFVRPTRKISVCRDPEDNALLECALSGDADVLVTGDRDLLVLHPYRDLQILRPVDFLRLLP